MKAKGKTGSVSTDISSAIARKAGLHLASQFPGRHRDKRISSVLQRCSPRMARLLVDGKSWTFGRLVECWQLFGGELIQTLFETPPQSGDDPIDRHALETARRLQEFSIEINERLRVLEEGTRNAERGRANLPAEDGTRKAGATAASGGAHAAQASLAVDGPSHRVVSQARDAGRDAQQKASRLGKDKRQT